MRGAGISSGSASRIQQFKTRKPPRSRGEFAGRNRAPVGFLVTAERIGNPSVPISLLGHNRDSFTWPQHTTELAEGPLQGCLGLIVQMGIWVGEREGW